MEEKYRVNINWLLRELQETNAQEVLDNFTQFSDIEIVTGTTQRTFSEEETKILASFSNELQERGYSCKFEEGYTIAQAIEASKRLNSWVSEIKNAKVDGRPLTNLEKYVYAYEIVTDFVYNSEKEEENWRVSRHPIQVLTGDKIVCAGYASLLTEMLNKLEIPCAYVHLEGKNGESGHAACAVFIKDERSGLKNVIFSDPTFGARGKNNPKDFQFAVMPKDFADKIWEQYHMDLNEIKAELQIKLSAFQNADEEIKYCEELFKDNMKKNVFSDIVYIDSVIKVFQSQGLSADAASVIAGARFWGQTVGQIVENRRETGLLSEQTEQELQTFARNKKDYSKTGAQFDGSQSSGRAFAGA